MTAVLGILSFLGALAPLLNAVLGWIERQSDQQAGAQIEAGAVTQVTAKTQAAIAQAVVNAPKTKAQLVSSLQAGTF